MKVEERGAPGFSKEYINRQQRICSEIRCLAFSFTRSLSFQLTPTHTLPPTHIRNFAGLQRSVMTPIFTYMLLDEFRHWRERKQSLLQHRQSAALHFLMCDSDLSRDYLRPPRGRPYHTFNKILLIAAQTCTEEKFCGLAITARELSQLLQLITCSDGLADTRHSQSCSGATCRLLNGPWSFSSMGQIQSWAVEPPDIHEAEWFL